MATLSAHVFAWYRHQFSYDAETGVLTRIRKMNSRGSPVACNYVAGSRNNKGYLTVRVAGRTVRVHRLIWEMFYGEDAPEEIDHENHIRDDNRIKNLRAATDATNAQNRLAPRRNACPYRGVSFDREHNSYTATIRVSGRTVNLGRHASPEVMAHRYNKAAVEFHGQFAQLNMIGGRYEE